MYRLLEQALVAGARRIGFQWDPTVPVWKREGLPELSNLAGPIQHVKCAILSALRCKVSADLCAWSGFLGGPVLDIRASRQLLFSSHVRERDKALVFGMAFFWGRCVLRWSLAGSVVVLTVTVIFFGIVLKLLSRYMKS